MKNKITFLSLIFSFSFLLFSCSTAIENTENENIKNKEGKKISSSATTKAIHYTIQKADEEIAQIMINGQNIEIKIGEIHYKSNLKGEKRKYQTREGGIMAEVKYKGNQSLKLRTPNANLKWKVKFYDDKFKISDNEENINPFQVKFKEENRSKVYLDNEELGNVRFTENKIKVEGSGIEYTIEINEMHPAFGVLIMEMSEMDKIILVAELLAKGQ